MALILLLAPLSLLAGWMSDPGATNTLLGAPQPPGVPGVLSPDYSWFQLFTFGDPDSEAEPQIPQLAGNPGPNTFFFTGNTANNSNGNNQVLLIGSNPPFGQPAMNSGLTTTLANDVGAPEPRSGWLLAFGLLLLACTGRLWLQKPVEIQELGCRQLLGPFLQTGDGVQLLPRDDG